MGNKNKEKLKKLKMEKRKASLKSALIACAAGGIAVGAAGAAMAGVAAGDAGAGVREAMLLSGITASAMSALGNAAVACTGKFKDKFNKPKAANALIMSTAAVSTLSFGIGACVGADTRKLTTSVINPSQPEHQIEQTVEVDPIPVIDEIQVER